MPTVKEIVDNAELREASEELERLTHVISDLQTEKRNIKKRIYELRASTSGLVVGETVVVNARGSLGVGGARGVFQGYCTELDSGARSTWANVLLINKDGRVGKRKKIFFEWEKE